jgi:hypothetical protein
MMIERTPRTRPAAPDDATRDADADDAFVDAVETDEMTALFPDEPIPTTPIEDFTNQPVSDAEPIEESEVISPPMDPVVTTDLHGQTQVLGGFAEEASVEMTAAPSALDGQPGDESLADAVRQALRRDATTTDLPIEVEVREGVAYLRGRVRGLEDVDSAESVAARVMGLKEVVEELEIAEL